MNIRSVGLGALIINVLMMFGCSDDSPIIVPYACSLPCLEVAPVISTNTVSSATGGTVDVTLKISGDFTRLSSLNINLRSTTSGSSAGSAVVFSPTQAVITETITVDSGTTVEAYYPYVSLYFSTPSNSTSTLIYRDTSISSTDYVYYEIIEGVGTPLSISPFAVPILQVQ